MSRQLTNIKKSNHEFPRTGIRCASELVFSKYPPTPKMEKHSPFNKKLTKQVAQAESLHLYHQLNVDEFSGISCTDQYSNGKDVDISGTNYFPFSFSCDPPSPSSTGTEYSNDNVFVRVGSLRCKSKSKVEELNKSLSLGKYFTQSPRSVLSQRSTSPSPSVSTPSTSLHHTGSFISFSPLHRSLSVSNPTKYSKRKKLSLFGRHYSEVMSSSVTSMHISPAPSGDVKIPSPARFTAMYHAVRKAISEHISVNTAELNVLEMRQKEQQNLNAAQTYDIEKLVKYLERVIKKLQYQQTQLDEIHEAYVLQQRYREGAFKLKSALNSSRVSSRSSKNELKADLNRSTETLCTLEQELVGLLGRFHFDMKGLLGFAKLRSGDQYEIVLRLGSQKWRMRGAIKSFNDQVWDNNTATMQPLLSDIISVKVMEIKLLGKHSTVGNVVCETKDLFKVEPQDLTIELNDTATLKLNLKVQWIPFDGYEIPVRTQNAASSWTSDFSRSRANSVAERPMSSYISRRNRLPGALSRPVSAIYAVPPNLNNSNNKFDSSTPLRIPENESDKEQNFKKEPERNTRHKSALSEEDAFLEAISLNVKLATSRRNSLASSSLTDDKNANFPKNSKSDILLSQRLLTAVTQTNLDLDDYRGRYKELCNLEDVVLKLLEKLKMQRCSLISTDGFSVVTPNDNTEDGDLNSKIFEAHSIGPLPTSGMKTCDEALVAHLNMVQNLLKNVGVFGPLKVREMLSLHKLQKQADVLFRLLEIATSEKEITFDDMKEFDKRRTLLEMWRSCCDGNTLFCVSAKTFRLELMSEFGGNLRLKHPDVAEQVFPELVRRILDRDDVTDDEAVTLFHVGSYVDEASDDKNEDFSKLIEKLALEMFITSTLSSKDKNLVLVAIKRVSSLLALHTSNLRALSHLLLDSDHQIRTAAAAHIRHISSEPLLCNKALLSFLELLESSLTRDRQCACISIGFLGAKECVPQLVQLFQGDPDCDVREAASNVLLSMGDQGIKARESASSALSVQTMTQEVASTNTRHLGTAL